MTQSQTLTFTNRTTSPFRYDIVGSFLRPAELKAAREKFANKEITKDDVKGGFELSFYGGLKMHDLGGLRINRC